MAALTLAAIGIYAAVSTFWSLPTAILTGTGAAAGLALVNSVGNLGGLAGPSIVGAIKQATGSFTAALLFLAGVTALGGLIALLFGYVARARVKPSAIVSQTSE
jgi:nitrate/nitrite transporter NarK